MKHRLSKAEQLRGTQKAISVLKRKQGGPVWLVPALERYAKRLREEIRESRR